MIAVILIQEVKTYDRQGLEPKSTELFIPKFGGEVRNHDDRLVVMRLNLTICLSLIAGGGIQALSGSDILQSCGGISGTGLFSYRL